MNSWTNVITFLNVFLIQNSQNRNPKAINLNWMKSSGRRSTRKNLSWSNWPSDTSVSVANTSKGNNGLATSNAPRSRIAYFPGQWG
jgi:hypothetical protein